jgi:hypothetical protein
MGPEQAVAFASLKQHLSDLAILTSPDPMLALLLYIAASPYAVNAALVQEQDREGTTRQCPVYYVSEVPTTSKCNMTELEKISYAVVMASRKLRHYFEAFKVCHLGQGTGRTVQKPRGVRPNCLMGSRTLRVPHHLRTQDNNQVAGPSRLHRRLDWADTAARRTSREGVDHPLR